MATPPRRALTALMLAEARTLVMRMPLALSADGRHLAFTVDNPRAAEPRESEAELFTRRGVSRADAGPGFDIDVLDLERDCVRRLETGGRSNWGPSWSPDGARLAFYSDRSGSVGLCTWQPATDRVKDVPGVVVRPLFGQEAPQWAPDGRYLLVKAVPPEADPDDLRHLCFGGRGAEKAARSRAGFDHFASPPSTAVQASWLEALRANLLLVDSLGRSEARTLVEGAPITWYAVSPSGNRVAYAVVTDAGESAVERELALHVVERLSNTRKILATGIRQPDGTSFAWSPDGARLAYFDRSACQLVEVERGQPGPSMDPGEAGHSGPWLGGPVWACSGRHVIGAVPGAVGCLAPDTGEVTWSTLPAPYTAMYLVRDAEGYAWQPFGNDAVVLACRNTRTHRAGFARVGRGDVEILHEADEALGALGHHAVARRGTRTWFYACESASHDTQLWARTLEQGAARAPARRLVSVNPALDAVTTGPVQLIEWRDAHSGERRRGALLLPPNAEVGQTHPLIVWVYGGALGSTLRHRFGFWSAPFNMQYFATHGYAVLHPDVPMGVGRPLADLAAGVLSGVDEAVARGYADPERLAVMGQSYGGYCTLGLLTQTPRFKAAVVSAGFGNLFSLYADFTANGEAPAVDYLERHQGRMQISPWEDMTRYIDNSPFFRLDRIETPVLLTAGEFDQPFRRLTEEVFVGLRRLGKTAEYVRYRGEGHVVQQPQNAVDFHERRLAWLTRYCR